jgi:hypothetical protein
MNRAELEHIIRAASGITNQTDINSMVELRRLRERISFLPMSPEQRTALQERLERVCARGGKP